MNERYDEFSGVILDVNDDLPTFRKDVRDIDEVCAPAVENGIASAIRKLRKLDVESAADVVVGLTTCVDLLRRKTDGEFNAPDVTTIRMQRLSDELQRLTATTHDVQDMERALRRATSKRDRLVRELTQLEREIESSC